MIGKFVMTENELTKKRPTPESVGMGSYTIDSHNVQRYITPEGYVQNEGDIGVPIRPVRNRLRLARAEEGPGGQSARAGVREQFAHRVRQHSHGAGVHDPGPIGRDGGGDGDRLQNQPCRMCLTRNSASACSKTARCSNTHQTPFRPRRKSKPIQAAPRRLLSASLMTNRAFSRATSLARPAAFTDPALRRNPCTRRALRPSDTCGSS